jgi:hypothetical protein
MGGAMFSMSVEEIPTDLSVALSHALRILSWQENLTQDEMPPPWMWPLEWELEIYFEDLQREREQKYSGRSDEPEYEMMTNELADEFHRSG